MGRACAGTETGVFNRSLWAVFYFVCFEECSFNMGDIAGE
jgi:hypothetical protein